MISIKQAIGKDEKWIYEVAFNDPALDPLFSERIDRIVGSFANNIIYNDKKKVGFINLVDEGINGYIFVDSGILKKYQGNGYGKEALRMLLEWTKAWDEVIVIEVGKENEPAINSVESNNGVFLDETPISYFYIMEYNKFKSKDTKTKMELLNYIDSKKESIR